MIDFLLFLETPEKKMIRASGEITPDHYVQLSTHRIICSKPENVISEIGNLKQYNRLKLLQIDFKNTGVHIEAYDNDYAGGELEYFMELNGEKRRYKTYRTLRNAIMRIIKKHLKEEK